MRKFFKIKIFVFLTFNLLLSTFYQLRYTIYELPSSPFSNYVIEKELKQKLLTKNKVNTGCQLLLTLISMIFRIKWEPVKRWLSNH